MLHSAEQCLLEKGFSYYYKASAACTASAAGLGQGEERKPVFPLKAMELTCAETVLKLMFQPGSSEL